MTDSSASPLPAMSPAPSEPPARTVSPPLVAYVTAVAWNALALAGWVLWLVLTTRQDPDWGDLVLLVGTMLGLGGCAVSTSLSVIAVAVMSRYGRWRSRFTDTGRAIRYGSVAAAIGLSPIGLVLLVSGFTA